MPLQLGSIIKSTEALDNTYFEGATIVIVELNNNGALGFITNRLFGRTLNELQEFKRVPTFPLYEGGIVDQEHLYFIHNKPQIIQEGTNLKDDLHYGGNFEQAVQAIVDKRLTTSDIKIFIGYCGWNAGELEAEIEEGSWVIDDADIKSCFHL